MIKSSLFGLLLMIGATVLQSTWLRAIEILSVVPDLPLLILIYISFRNTLPKGQVIGFLSGFLQDSISVIPLGTTSLIQTATAFAFNAFSGKFYIDKLLMPFLFAVAGTIIKGLLSEVMQLFFSEFNVLSYSFFSHIFWLEMLYTAVLAPLVFFILGLMDRFLLGSEKHR
ncbi:MAG: rod shape-determining protein MreD [Spirochaetes bacterium]|nr:rod shape-determining protein MreD [Spirochaetota bacterium]